MVVSAAVCHAAACGFVHRSNDIQFSKKYIVFSPSKDNDSVVRGGGGI